MRRMLLIKKKKSTLPC
ncbi:hypothetical protein SAMN04490205_4837 [Pseudomonas trivialis]|uniref:Uncharacterized protein n=1 Tax=Pseudomonas trivialis TaxID=200450 RepID=A0ABY0USG7_9PSED|nr:hypothetical protein SAMN04490205_4837 [Pseudomonas trivialis]